MTDELETVFPLPLWFVLAATLLFSCAGCVSDPKVCYMKMLGQTEQGYSVVLQQCMTPEEFQKSQE